MSSLECPVALFLPLANYKVVRLLQGGQTIRKSLDYYGMAILAMSPLAGGSESSLPGGCLWPGEATASPVGGGRGQGEEGLTVEEHRGNARGFAKWKC